MCVGGGITLVLRCGYILGAVWEEGVSTTEKNGGLARLKNEKGRLSESLTEQPGNHIPWTVLGEFHKFLGSNFSLRVIRIRIAHT